MGCVGVCEGDPVKGWLLIKKKVMTPARALAPTFSGRAGKTLSPAPWPRPPIWAVSTRRAGQSCIDPPFWARRRARRNLGVRFRLIRAVSTRRAGQSCTDPRSEPNRVGASPMAARARTREVLRPDRGPAVEARSPPTQMSCGVEPELWRPPGRRNSAWMTKLVVYNDYVCFQCLS